ncbi:uncharacterized protein BO87DRAFT_380581 [Aspergillus neoniger CBS 115656]|uniref:Uncharacterized protein n=1 Tax=Aspergillus neoniger (strain CBS 115656) TaxID=1448310 RepID=A0A318Y5H6_ASPNB|nr:hypothetical protein BO87DRAFT_380581 [Aspergillus neoniger CBS 115656]PYH29515.1 hypothetical protein BO87DRAFT_380581 [Aspergillus neoniger CBS 115656]
MNCFLILLLSFSEMICILQGFFLLVMTRESHMCVPYISPIPFLGVAVVAVAGFDACDAWLSCLLVFLSGG